MRFPQSTMTTVWRFAALTFAANVGCVFGLFPTNALLISRSGPDTLFAAYLWSALAVLGFTGLCFLLADRLPRRRLFTVSHLLAGGAVVAAWWIIQQPDTALWWYTLLRALFYGFYILSSLQFWLLASDHFSSYEAKRVYPYLTAATIGGMMTGGFITTLAAGHLPAADFLPCWAAILALSPLLLLRLSPRRLGAGSQSIAADAHAPTTSWSLVLLLFLFWTTYAFLCHGVDYRYNAIAVAALPDADQLTAFFGRVTGCASVVVLLYQLLLARRLAARVGIDRALLLIPGLTILACGLLYREPSLLSAAIAESTIFFFVDFAGTALIQPLFNTIDRTIRGRIKMCTEGFGRAAGVVALFLLVAGSAAWVGLQRLDALLLGVALVFLGFPFLLHRIYLRHLVRCLRSPDQELVVNAIQALGEPNKTAAAAPLLRLLRETTQLPLQRTIVLSLGQMRSGEAFYDIVRLFAVRNESLQNAVVEALSDYRNYHSVLAIFRLMKSGANVSLQVRMNAVMVLTRLIGRAMTPFLLAALDDPDPRVQSNTLEALGVLRDRHTIPLLVPFLAHPHHRVRGSAIMALYPFRFRRRLRAKVLLALDVLYRSTHPLEHRTALHVIGTVRCKKYLPDLLQMLTSDARESRRLAAVALAKMEVHRYADVLVELLLDDNESFAIDTAKRLGQFPAASRWTIFDRLDRLPETARARLFARLTATGLDFSEEQELLARRATLFTYAPW